MRGETITLIHRTKTGEDPGGGIIWDTSEETVEDVLIQDSRQSNLTDGIRPDGIQVAKTIHMPRAWPYRSLRGAKAVIDGVEYTVIGDPAPTRAASPRPDGTSPSNSPTPEARRPHAMAKVKLNLAGFRAVRQSAPIQQAIDRQATLIAARANGMAQVEGATYEAATHVSTPKGSVALATTGHGSEGNVKAMEDNAKHNTLLKAVKRQ